MNAATYLALLFCFVAPFVALDVLANAKGRECQARGGLAVRVSPWRVNCHVPPRGK